ncbi:MAG: hypothetical protein LUG18_15290 [Candidatus Azobacteroides sp.]|nr:hypothetical protein [Candidatus Azobacteroides sp.]
MSIRPWNLVPGCKLIVQAWGSSNWVSNHVISEDVIYVDSETGDDTEGTGAADSPFKTMNKAFEVGTSEVVCRGVFEEDMVKGSVNYCPFFADFPHAATYIGPMPTANSQRLHLHNGWNVYFNSNFIGNRASYTSLYGLMKNPEERKYFAVMPVGNTMACSSYRVSVSFFPSNGFAAYTGCVEDAQVWFRDTGGENVVARNCTFFVGTGKEEMVIEGETDEEKSESLASQLNKRYNTTRFSNVRITSKPLFNDPENGDLTIHPESVVLQNKLYINSTDYYYPAAYPPGISLKILPNSTGEKYAFDERTIQGYIQITENKTIEPVRDEAGDYIDEGSIDSKVITLQEGSALKGIHTVFENDELNSGLRLGKEPWQTLQIRYRYAVSSTSDLASLNREGVYINTNDFNLVLKNSLTSAERPVVPGESFVIRENESLDAAPDGARVAVFYPDDSGWMDCLCATDLLVKRVGDEYAGPADRDEDGNILTNANPAFYSAENRDRPGFPVTAKYVQYRVKISKK